MAENLNEQYGIRYCATRQGQADVDKLIQRAGYSFEEIARTTAGDHSEVELIDARVEKDENKIEQERIEDTEHYGHVVHEDHMLLDDVSMNDE